MTANELRIGNWVMDDDESYEIFQVASIEKGEEETEGMYFINGGWIDDVLPIPLTEEWLLKFGFEKDDPFFTNMDSYSFNGLTMEFYKKECQFHYQGADIEFKYVHQLQNLYFALTGEELEIK